MINKNNFIILLYFLCVSCTSRVEQNFKKTNTVRFDVEQLEVEDDKSNLNLNIKIPLNKLVFNKKKDGFYSNITVDVFILNDNQKLFYSNSWDENIKLEYFEQTKVHKPFDINHFFNLSVGEYKINIIVNDFENHLSFISEGNLIVNNDHYLSDIYLFYKKDGDLLKYFDNLEISGIDTLWANYEMIKRNKNNETEKIALSYEFSFKNNLIFSNSIIKETLIEENNNYYEIALINKPFDKLKIEFSYNNQIRTEIFTFNNIVMNDFNIEMLIGPMQYVLDYREFINFSDMKYEEQLDFIEKFWDINGNNEKFKEFYYRVEHANNKFLHYNMDGWKSDRGKIYIIHGEPREIKYDFNEQGEFEIWYYSSNKKFIFLNRFGFYELYHGE